MSKNSNLFNLAKAAREKAYCPYSHFKVGATLETHSGEFISGFNIENASYGGTVCAERVAIWKAVSEGHKRGDFKRIQLVTDPKAVPCGLCLQVMAEFFDPSTEIILSDPSGKSETVTFDKIMPYRFDPPPIILAKNK